MERLSDTPERSRADLSLFPRLLYGNRWRIIIFTVSVMLVAAAVNFLIPNYYLSSGSLLPTGQQSATSAIGSLANAIPGIELMKNDPDPTASSQLFPDILKSDVLRYRVLAAKLPQKITETMQASTIAEAFSSNPAVALRQLSSATIVRKEKTTGMIYISFEWTDPKFAQFVTAEYVRQLDAFCSNERFARLDENRLFVQGRLAETESRLRAAEDSLLQYREQNRNYMGASSPELQLEHERRVRKVAEIGEVYGLLSQQLEMATIEAKRKKPVVAILDYPTVPQEKSGPRRLTNIVQVTLAAFLLSCGFVIVSNYVKTYASPQELEQLGKIKSELGSQLTSATKRLVFRRKVQV